jgi:hypothetical protein
MSGRNGLVEGFIAGRSIEGMDDGGVHWNSILARE